MTMKAIKFWGACALLAFAAPALTSCSAKRKAAKDAKAAAAARDAKDAAALGYTPGVDVTEASIRGSEFGSVPELGTIRFEYDSYSLSESALDMLKKNAQYLKENREVETLVAGHCDDRGTVEYNLSLAQNRAKEVREYYIRLGVNGKSIATISYGEESPVCAEATEECWSQNRRAETRVRSRTASNGKVGPAAQ